MSDQPAGIPDVPLSRLRPTELHPDAARVRYITPIQADPMARCQVCGAAERLAALDAVVDRRNGQRIPIAVCLACLQRAVGWFEYYERPPRRRKAKP